MIVTALEGDTVDLLCHRHLRTTAGGVVEATYAINPGLAALGVFLPMGTLVTLPDVKSPSKTTTQTGTVTLWD